mmetsp:Transcript_25980/g.56626  ORF Transcript_25980/g.56626 Transcript_25980/m.56626 type:complete len:128 (-) Transcript_25980:958-1341(-)
MRAELTVQAVALVGHWHQLQDALVLKVVSIAPTGEELDQVNFPGGKAVPLTGSGLDRSIWSMQLGEERSLEIWFSVEQSDIKPHCESVGAQRLGAYTQLLRTSASVGAGPDSMQVYQELLTLVSSLN